MKNNRIYILAFGMMLTAFNVCAQDANAPAQQVTIASVRDPQWMSYRAAYKELRWFEEYKKRKNYIRLTFQLMPKDRNASLENISLQLIGKTMRLDLPLDEELNAVIPDLKEAYDEDAEFRLNRSAGTFDFQYTGSIKLNPNGIYPVKDLHEACEQLLTILRDARMTFRIKTMGKKCTGVSFDFSEKIAAPKLFYKSESGQIVAIDKVAPLLKRRANATAMRFLEQTKTGEIIAEDLPMSIHGIYE
ncbi:hypothetical protein ACO0LM_23370 [Undibacterium sp. Di26W]|uniref:hypothetical protein n=1 Tax=Undibacterium sp. Di26W TaxID=3413035 RepID=UPI003BEFF113